MSEKQFPQVVGKIENQNRDMEWLEAGVVLAKQVLSQLSYTPTKSLYFRGKANE